MRTHALGSAANLANARMDAADDGYFAAEAL